MAKYFKYAIGEIILVMIGILLALQVNNWNENRKLKNQEINAYCKIKEDLNADIQNIDRTIVSIEKRQDAARTILIKTLKLQDDKTVILKDYLAAVRSLDFIPTKAAINDITSSGKLENLKNSKVKNAILKFYVELDFALKVIDGNENILRDKAYGYDSYTSFGIQELPPYKDIYGKELQQLLKSSNWQKDPNSSLFKHFRDHMNTTLITCQRKVEILSSVKTSAINLEKLITPICK